MQRWLQVLTGSTHDFAEVLATGDLDAGVPACPGWSLAGLGEHLGGVHQWAAHAVTHGSPDGEPTAPPAGRTGLVEWYRASAARLLEVLTRTPPEAPAWNFGPKPRTAGFWRRRQVHEVDMHLWDARSSQGQRHEIDAERAVDGLDEALAVFFPRQVRLGRTPPLDRALALEATHPEAPDPVAARFVICGDGTGPARDPAATVSGPPDALLLLVWKRISLDDVRLQVTGDHDWAKTALSRALTP